MIITFAHFFLMSYCRETMRFISIGQNNWYWSILVQCQGIKMDEFHFCSCNSPSMVLVEIQTHYGMTTVVSAVCRNEKLTGPHFCDGFMYHKVRLCGAEDQPGWCCIAEFCCNHTTCSTTMIYGNTFLQGIYEV